MEDIIKGKNFIETETKQIRTEVKFLRDGEHTYRYLLKKNGVKVIILQQSLC